MRYTIRTAFLGMTTVGFTLPLVFASPSRYPILNSAGTTAILFCPLAAWVVTLALRALGYSRPVDAYTVAICACLTTGIAGPLVHGIRGTVLAAVMLIVWWVPQLLWVGFFELCESEERNAN